MGQNPDDPRAKQRETDRRSSADDAGGRRDTDAELEDAPDMDQPPVPENPEPATQERYEQKTTELDWVWAPEGEEWFQVQTIPVLRLLRTAKEHGLLSMLDAEDDFDFEAAVQDGRWDAFIEELIVPNVVQPQVFWSRTDHLDSPDPENDPGVFDLTVMEPEDIFALVNGMSGVTEDELQERLDDRFQK